MTILTSQMSLLLLLHLSLTTFHKTMSTNEHRLVQCNEKDQETLLIFKKGINASYGQIPSWKYLNLSWIDLHKETNFPQALNTLPSLLELHLSVCNLNINPSIEYLNLSSLVTLDLSYNNFTSKLPNWFFNLTKDLTYLNLKSSNIHGGLPNMSPVAEIVDLSYNSFSGTIPHSWKNLKYLNYINLWSNKLSGEVLTHLSDLTQLKFLNLGGNKFCGTIPTKMPQYLKVIILRANQFEGIIPPQIFNLSYLFHLDLADNKLSGSISKFHTN
ncbi:hypothetical protein P8452_25562 [Trifolium repens]|nr:hypothetical protein P8452_25562 [Trifolium repens]